MSAVKSYREDIGDLAYAAMLAARMEDEEDRFYALNYLIDQCTVTASRYADPVAVAERLRDRVREAFQYERQAIRAAELSL